MPRLTLRPHALFVAEAVTGFASDNDVGSFVFIDSETKLRELMPAVQRTVEYVSRECQGVADLERALRSGYAADQTEPRPDLVVLLAATGRGDAALELARLMQTESELPEAEFDRFVRQLELWVAAGSPEPPGLDTWPPEYFQDTVREAPGETRARERREKPLREAALKAARPYASTDSLLELTERLERELGERGLHQTRATTAQWARLLQAGHWGRTRAGLTLLRTLLLQYKEAANALRAVFGDGPLPLGSTGGPEWATPPSKASFSPPLTERESITINVLPEGEAVLRRLVEESTRNHLLVQVQLWFDHSDDPGVLDAFIGAQRVGQVTGHEAVLLEASIDAAARFQELPQLPGILQWLEPPLGVSLTACRPAALPPPPRF
jgi:hypothetical protein